MSWCTRPPSAIAIVCTPRQMPSIGICRSNASRVMSSSGRSRTLLMLCSAGEGSSSAHSGLKSPPPVSSRASIVSSVSSSTLRSATGGITQDKIGSDVKTPSPHTLTINSYGKTTVYDGSSDQTVTITPEYTSKSFTNDKDINVSVKYRLDGYFYIEVNSYKVISPGTYTVSGTLPSDGGFLGGSCSGIRRFSGTPDSQARCRYGGDGKADVGK